MSAFFDLLAQFKTDIEALEKLLTGGDAETVTINGVSKSSLAKSVKDNFASIQAMVQGKTPFESKVLLDAAGAPAADVNGNLPLAEVWNDSALENNGIYGWSGSAWVKSPYDPEDYAKLLASNYFISFVRQPVLDVNSDVVKYSAGFHHQRGDTVTTVFDPLDTAQESFEAPISGSVSGAVMHYFDTKIDASVANPIIALGGGQVIDTDVTLIPLGIYYSGRYTPVFTGEAVDVRRAGVDLPVLNITRPILIDGAATLSSVPRIYVPREICLSLEGDVSSVLSVSNALSGDVIGNYCAIDISVAASVEQVFYQTIYLDLADSAVKKAVHPATPVTASLYKFVPLVSFSGGSGVWRSASGLPVLEVSAMADSEALGDLYKSLNSKTDSTHMVLVGDSITWGMSATDNGPGDPRGHALTDARDVLASSSWANKLRRWCGSVAAGLQGFVESAPGERVYSREMLVDPFKTRGFVLLDAENRESVKSGTFRSEPIIKSTLDVSSGIGCKLRFSFVGDAFDMIFTTQGTDEWKILVDGVEVAHHLPSGEFSWSNELAITGLTFGKHVVDIYNLNDAKNIRIEAFRFYKKLTFTNNGLIGTNTKQWLPEGSLLAAAVPVSATHLFIQLGTNDRAIAAESLLPISPVRVGINLRLIVDWLRINRPDTKVILMAPPKALGTADQYGDPAKYFASSDDIAREVANLADDMGLAFISNYDPTCILDLNGEVFLADNLHPNDYGHSKIFEHIVASIEGERVSV